MQRIDLARPLEIPDGRRDLLLRQGQHSQVQIGLEALRVQGQGLVQPVAGVVAVTGPEQHDPAQGLDQRILVVLGGDLQGPLNRDLQKARTVVQRGNCLVDFVVKRIDGHGLLQPGVRLGGTVQEAVEDGHHQVDIQIVGIHLDGALQFLLRLLEIGNLRLHLGDAGPQAGRLRRVGLQGAHLAQARIDLSGLVVQHRPGVQRGDVHGIGLHRLLGGADGLPGVAQDAVGDGMLGQHLGAGFGRHLLGGLQCIVEHRQRLAGMVEHLDMQAGQRHQGLRPVRRCRQDDLVGVHRLGKLPHLLVHLGRGVQRLELSGVLLQPFLEVAQRPVESSLAHGGFAQETVGHVQFGVGFQRPLDHPHRHVGAGLQVGGAQDEQALGVFPPGALGLLGVGAGLLVPAQGKQQESLGLVQPGILGMLAQEVVDQIQGHLSRSHFTAAPVHQRPVLHPSGAGLGVGRVEQQGGLERPVRLQVAEAIVEQHELASGGRLVAGRSGGRGNLLGEQIQGGVKDVLAAIVAALPRLGIQIPSPGAGQGQDQHRQDGQVAAAVGRRRVLEGHVERGPLEEISEFGVAGDQPEIGLAAGHPVGGGDLSLVELGLHLVQGQRAEDHAVGLLHPPLAFARTDGAFLLDAAAAVADPADPGAGGNHAAAALAAVFGERLAVGGLHRLDRRQRGRLRARRRRGRRHRRRQLRLLEGVIRLGARHGGRLRSRSGVRFLAQRRGNQAGRLGGLLPLRRGRPRIFLRG